MIVGCNSSGASLALASVCEEYKVPSVATCATNSKVTEDDNGNVREWTFRVCLADPALGNVMAKYAYDELGLRRIGILKEISSDYSVGISDNFSDTFTSLGGEIVGVESYTAGDVDFRAQMTALHQKTPDALFLPMKSLRSPLFRHATLGWTSCSLGRTAGWQRISSTLRVAQLRVLTLFVPLTETIASWIALKQCMKKHIMSLVTALDKTPILLMMHLL